jgi:hypothetical protein
VDPGTSVSPPSGTTHSWHRLVLAAALACIVLSTVVFVRRGHAVVLAAAESPGVAVSSGFEEESLFAVWRAVHGQPVYADVTRMPFASAYFNWLFYAGYAMPVGAAVSLGHDASIIPLAGRLVTAAGALAGVATLFWLIRRVLDGQNLLSAALATFVFFGPLVGWWAHTLRPDVWALTLETAAVLVLLLRHRSHPLGSALLAGLFFYAAWSCKQIYFLGLGGALSFLLWRRQWRPAAALVALSVGLWISSFVLLGPGYRGAFRGTVTTNVYYLDLGLSSLRDMLVKSAPFWVMLAGALWLRVRARSAATASPLAQDAVLLGTLGLLVAAPLAFAASCKMGASTNYYFTALLMLSLLTAGLIAALPCTRLVAAGLGLAAGLQSLVLSGHAGNIDLSNQTRELAAVWSVWQRQPEPRFASCTNLNLPWLNTDSPPLVIAFNYGLDRAAGRALEHDGVGGLIANGYFRSLLLPADTGTEYDGGSLRLYSRGETVANVSVYHRKPDPLP